jgi:hypothetical protein
MRIDLRTSPFLPSNNPVTDEEAKAKHLGQPKDKSDDIYDLDLNEIQVQDNPQHQLTHTGVSVCLCSQHCTGTCAGVCDRC